jgi:single-strand DNA-binding protein
MANLNKVLLIGRLTRDPEHQSFANGGKVAKFGFAVNNRKKNNQTGEWEDVPVFLDVEAFNRESGRQLADLVLQYLHKGSQVFLEGHLQLDRWTSKEGEQRSKLKIVLDNLQFLEPRPDGGEGGSRPARSAPPAGRPAGAPRSAGYSEPEPTEPPDAGGEGGSDIPF